MEYKILDSAPIVEYSDIMSESPRYYGHNVAQVLRSQGRKARWLAGEVGVSESLISKLVRGERLASEQLAEDIARSLGVPLCLLFELHERSDTESLVEVT